MTHLLYGDRIYKSNRKTCARRWFKGCHFACVYGTLSALPDADLSGSETQVDILNNWQLNVLLAVKLCFLIYVYIIGRLEL